MFATSVNQNPTYELWKALTKMKKEFVLVNFKLQLLKYQLKKRGL